MSPDGRRPEGERLDLKLGFSCNNRCRFCVQGDKRLRLPDRSTEQAKALLASARRRCDQVVLTGGEVTIRDDLPEIVRAARDLGYRVIQVQTNGRMLQSAAFARGLADAGVTEFSPALHGPDAETHDGLTRSPGSFRQTVRGIRNVAVIGLPVVMNSVVVQANFRTLPQMARLFVALGATRFQFAFVHALGEAARDLDSIVPRLSEIEPFLHEALRIGRAAGVPCTSEAVPLCFLRGIEDAAAERIIPATRILDGERVVDDWNEARRREAKAHGPPCQGCRWEACCEGPWKEYPERFGWAEFRGVGWEGTSRATGG